MPTERSKTPRIVNARSRRQRKHFVPIGDGEYMQVRKVDLPTLLFEGVIPSPMLSALMQLEQTRAQVDQGNFEKMLELIGSEEFDSMLELARRIAVAFVIEPKLTFSKQASIDNPDLLWVGGVSDVEGEGSKPQISEDVPLEWLFAIWKVLMGQAKIFVLNEDDATEFRQNEPASDATVVSDGDGSRSEAVDVSAAGISENTGFEAAASDTPVEAGAGVSG